MAGFRTHITVAGALGVAYGATATSPPMHFPVESGILAAGLTTVGGMLPDLDSHSGVPVREMFGLAAALVPVMLIPWLSRTGLSPEGVLAAMLGCYLFIRYVLSRLFKKVCVHRGMYHSIPAMLISGLVVYLGYHAPDRQVRALLAIGVMVGFLSHLVLDELYSVNFHGVTVSVNQFAGSAVKFVSPSWPATAFCYFLLGGLIYLAYVESRAPALGRSPPSHLAAIDGR